MVAEVVVWLLQPSTFYIMISEKNVRKYCCENISLIENYEEAIKDNTRIWDCHHRGEILPCGVFSARDLMENKLYWDRPASELIFLPHGLHYSIHLRGNQFTKGVTPWNKGKMGVYSEETLMRMRSAAHISHSDKDYKERQSKSHKGKKMPPRSEEHKSKLSKSLLGHSVSETTRRKIGKKRSACNLGRKWFTDGTNAKFISLEDAPQGWTTGRPFKRRKTPENGK